MGKLVWAAIGFTAAVLMAEYALPTAGLPYIAAALAVLSGLCLLLRRHRRQAVTVLLSAALGLLCWWGRYELHVAPCEALAGQDLTVTARVTEYPQVNEDYSRVTVKLLTGAPRERAYLYLYHEDLPPLRPGDILTGEIRTSSVMERGRMRQHTYTSAGISLRGYFRGEVEVVGRWRFAWLYFPQEIARYVRESCEGFFSGREAVFMKALLTGDKQDLYDDAELYGDMRAAGMLHAVAVSGMHLLVIVNFLCFALGRGRRTTLLAMPVMAVFCLMAGSGSSVVRAVVMQTMLMSAPLFRRESDPPSGIAAALLFLLLVNPMAVGGIGFQLSFLCVSGYAVFGEGLSLRARRGRHWRNPMVRFAAGTLFGTLCATVFSVPVSAHYFGAVPLLSPLANFLTLPVIELCFGGGYLLCGLGAVFPAAAVFMAKPLSWAVRWCMAAYGIIGNIPVACLYTADRNAMLWLGFVYVLLIAWLLLRRRGVRIRPGLPVLAAVVALFLVFLGNTAALRMGRRELAVLDVGQGECVVLLDKSSTVVIDCGGSGMQSAGDTAADYILSTGSPQADALILTHLHEDHTNGVEALLSRLPVKRLFLPADADDGDGRLEALIAAAERSGTEVVLLSESAEARIGDLSLSLLLSQAGSDENERGVVVLAEYPGCRALVMGDGGESTELALLAPDRIGDVDVLVAGHHGSKTASGALFLRSIRAETAVISAGYNSYGLPAEETVARLEQYCDTVLRTDTMGSVILDLKEIG